MRTLTRRLILLAAMATPLAAHGSANAQGQPQGSPQSWPAGTIKLIVPYPPGGSTDVIARLVQPCLQQRLGATVIIENRPGASGSVGTAAVAKSPPDGNTWLIVFDNHAANPFVLPGLPYDTEKDSIDAPGTRARQSANRGGCGRRPPPTPRTVVQLAFEGREVERAEAIAGGLEPCGRGGHLGRPAVDPVDQRRGVGGERVEAGGAKVIRPVGRILRLQE